MTDMDTSNDRGASDRGDPISSVLFVIVMKYLSRELSKMSTLPDFQFHPMCKRNLLTHLIFEDDLMIFCKGNLSSSRVMEALQHFSVQSSQYIYIFVCGKVAISIDPGHIYMLNYYELFIFNVSLRTFTNLTSKI